MYEYTLIFSLNQLIDTLLFDTGRLLNTDLVCKQRKLGQYCVTSVTLSQHRFLCLLLSAAADFCKQFSAKLFNPDGISEKSVS